MALVVGVMKVTLMTCQDDLNCYGLRCLSAVLRERGVATDLLFLDRWGPFKAWTKYQGGEAHAFEPRILNQVAELCADANLVGLSVMTLYYDASVQLSDYLRNRLRAPVIWGGIHPLCYPEECLEHADAVCLGEAEDTLLDVVDRIAAGRDLAGVPGVWFNADGVIIRNPIRQPTHDLDRLPPPDISVDRHFVYGRRGLRPLTSRELLRRWTGQYMTINARGCDLRCTYCCNSQLAQRFDWTIVRRKSVSALTEELVRVVRRYPSLRRIKLSDDAFGDLPENYIRDFAEDYRHHIALPLGIPGFSPFNLTEAKLAPLVDAGLQYVRLGIQSGSPRIRKLYGRRDTNEQIIRAVELVQAHRPAIQRLKLDIITDNPWETDADVIDTIRLLLRLPRPYDLALFSLTLFPGTPLFLKAQREGIVRDQRARIYRSHFYNVDTNRRLNRILELFKHPVVRPDAIEELLEVYRDPARFDPKLEAYLDDLPRQPRMLGRWLGRHRPIW